MSQILKQETIELIQNSDSKYQTFNKLKTKRLSYKAYCDLVNIPYPTSFPENHEESGMIIVYPSQIHNVEGIDGYVTWLPLSTFYAEFENVSNSEDELEFQKQIIVNEKQNLYGRLHKLVDFSKYIVQEEVTLLSRLEYVIQERIKSKIF